jgi:hypothetical protein
MKTNHLKILAILLILMGLFSACNKQTSEQPNVNLRDKQECGKIEKNETEYVTMQVIPEQISSETSAVLKIENHTKGVLSFDVVFSLEFFNENKWEEINLYGIGWENIELGMSAGESREDKLNFYTIVKENNNGKMGKYRIIKKFMLYSDFPYEIDKELEKFSLCAEFEII